MINAIEGDVLRESGDILVLKYADAPHGADGAVARAIGANFALAQGEHAFFAGDGKIGAREVLVLGVGRLRSFEYPQIQRFAEDALRIIERERPGASRVLFTIHGPGYGLDELASTDSLIRGLKHANSRVSVTIVERDKRRVSRLAQLLGSSDTQTEFSAQRAEAISHGNAFDRRLFTAMPFVDKYRDHWELAIEAAGHECGFVCERLDHVTFHGDIVAEIRNRIEKSRAVLALLDESNANVFLEVGYAWGVKRPTLLMLQEGVEAPFDVRGHNIIRYNRLGELKERLKGVITELAKRGEI